MVYILFLSHSEDVHKDIHSWDAAVIVVVEQRYVK